MRAFFKFLFLSVLSVNAVADVVIIPNLKYSNGASFSKDNIKHFQIELLNKDGNRIKEFKTTDLIILNNTLDNAHSIRGRTVLKDGAESVWSKSVNLSRPLPPGFKITITVENNL